MRNLSLSLAVAAAIAGVAQSQQVLEIHPGILSLASRGNIATTSSGFLFQGFLAAQNHGIGDNGVTSEISGHRSVVQDQIANTLGQFNVQFRTGTDAAGPGLLPTDVIAYFGPVNLPASTLPGAIAWQMTVTFAPITVPSTGFWSAGVELLAGTATDALYLQGATELSNGQHAAAPHMTWQDIGGVVSLNASKRSWRIGVRTAQNVFQIGNVDAIAPLNHFGNGGYFPNTALTGTGPTSQGLAFRCAHNAGATAAAAVLMSVDFAVTPTTVFGFNNTLYLDLATIAPFTIASGPADGSTLPFLAAGLDALPSAGGLRLAFQAIVINGGTFDFTNAAVVTLN